MALTPNCSTDIHQRGHMMDAAMGRRRDMALRSHHSMAPRQLIHHMVAAVVAGTPSHNIPRKGEFLRYISENQAVFLC